LEEFDRLYARLGVHFEETLGESFYNDKLQPMVDALLESGIASHSEGAVIVSFDKEDGKGLDDTPMLIRKKDGAALYATTDLATVRHRIDTWKPAHVLYVTDTRQQLHFRQLFACCKKLGWTEANLVHVWFGLLSLPGGTMSTRKGNVINLKDLLDEAVRRARVVVDEKNPDLPEETRADIAEAVGVGAVRYADLSQNPQSNVVFDWDKMLALDGNTAPYLMYTYARCRSLQAKGGIENAPVGVHVLSAQVERNLALQLMRFPEAVNGVLKSHRPNLLCDYLFGLGSLFNRFYYELPVLKAEGEERAARLALVESTARVLATGMGLLGIRPLERM
jgi:arginyl-tRNA synthetase